MEYYLLLSLVVMNWALLQPIVEIKTQDNETVILAFELSTCLVVSIWVIVTLGLIFI